MEHIVQTLACLSATLGVALEIKLLHCILPHLGRNTKTPLFGIVLKLCTEISLQAYQHLRALAGAKLVKFISPRGFCVCK